MKQNKNKRILLCALSFLALLTFSSPFIVSYYYLPSQIKLTVGQEHKVNFDIPMKAQIVSKELLKVKNAKSLLDDEAKVKLNEPLYLEMDTIGKTSINLSIFGGIPLKTVSVEAMPYKEVIPCGDIIGVKVSSDGICVLGTGEFEVDSKMVNPSGNNLQKGDIIIEANGLKPKSKEDFREIIQANQDNPMQIEVIRDSKNKNLEIVPIYSQKEEEYKIGAWIKDSTQGIGTLTYFDPETLSFGALGHGITDVDLKKVMPIREGEITTASITAIKKGEKGEPGEISGVIQYNEKNIIGKVEKNTSLGIYGTINDRGLETICHNKMPIAFQNEVHEGGATILANVTGDGVGEYKVYIQKVAAYSAEPSKGMVVKIIDEELLSLTSGIVQGMSGSPIIQDGKLIGAITHVFVQDPTKGYGIFIENMINNEEK
ncbi:MAG: SpoIVB peptidase [Cellulosilyticaceae bacterium]